MDETPKTPRGRRKYARRAIEDTRHIADGAYRRADGIVDRGQHEAFRFLWLFLPAPAIARRPRFQQLLASVFLADAARDGLRYGALIAVASNGGSALDAALVGVASLVPPTLLGLYGGAVADALPKRIALGAIYVLDAAACFIIPVWFGTGLGAIIMLIFAVNVFGQVSGPTEQSFAPLVASDEELATANSLSSLASNLGTVFGTALMAPILVRVAGVRAVFYVAGILLFLASGRILNVRSRRDQQKVRWRRPDVNIGVTVRWLVDQPAVATMIVVGVLAGTANVVLQTLAPRYVQTVLGVDPADAVYVFAPSSFGLALALFAAPKLIRLRGERQVAILGFVATAISLGLLGLVKQDLATFIDPVNPLRAAGIVGIHLGGPLRTASFLVLPLGFGIALTTMSVQTYINRRVPLAYQGRAFALQSTLKNGSSIIPLLTFGVLATIFGVDTMLIFSPVLLLGVAVALVRLSEYFGGRAPSSRIEVLSSFWDEPDVPPPPAPAPDVAAP
jgi:MFS family permease